MNEPQLAKISESLSGLSNSEWSRVKQHVDMIFSSKAAKVELDDSEELNQRLKVEFSFQRFGEK